MRNRTFQFQAIGWLLTAAMIGTARGDNWPGWRGALAEGISREADVPLAWGPSKNIVWKTEIPGAGHSSPIVWDDAVFVTTAKPNEQKRILLRLDRRTGKIVWERTVLTAPLEPIHTLNTYASSTPVTNGQSVFVSFLDRKQMFVAAYDFEGEKLWEVRPGPFASKHGFCTCPVLYKDALFVNGDHDGDSFIALLDQATGATRWKTPREKRTRSYCTPIVVREGDKDLFMLNGNYCTAAYEAETGKKVWICDGPSEQMVATLVHTEDMVFSLGGFPERHLLAIRRGGSGDVNSQIVWKVSKGIPYVPSPLLYGDWLHVVSDEGIYTCFEPATGKTRGQRRAVKHTSSSIVGACDRIYITDDLGKTLVLKNSPEFEKLAENSVGEDVFSTPAISQGSFFIRGARHLYRIGGAENVASK